MYSCAIGVDLGGTHLRAAVVAADGTLLARRRVELQDTAVDTVVAGIDALRGELVGDDVLLRATPVGIGVAAQLWLKQGRVAVAPNLGWHDVPLRDLLVRALGVNVRLVNDLNAITCAEARHWASDNVACVFVGTGVGMGAVCQGLLIEGADGLATELGHVKVASAETGRLCGCGERGCLEAYVGGAHLGARLLELAAARTCVISIGSDAAAVEAAVVAGDAVASALWNETAEYLGRAIGSAVALFNPDLLVLGGGVLVHAPTLEQRLRAALERAGPRSHLRRLRVQHSALGDDAGVVGAGLLALSAS